MGESIDGVEDGGGGDMLQHTQYKLMLEVERTKRLWGNKGNPASPVREVLGVTAWLSRSVRSKFSEAGYLPCLRSQKHISNANGPRYRWRNDSPKE